MYIQTTLSDLPDKIYIGQTVTSLRTHMGSPLEENNNIWIYRDANGLISVGITDGKVSSITFIDG